MNQVLTAFFSTLPDPQRKKSYWAPDIQSLMPLVSSVQRQNDSIVVFHDCFNDTYSFYGDWKQVAPSGDYTPNVERWFCYLSYLKQLKDLPEFVFFVDSTDVEMLNSPFAEMKPGIIYTGNESNKNMKHKWLTSRTGHLTPDFKKEYEKLLEGLPKNMTLINCGLFGTDAHTAIEFLTLLCGYHETYSKGDTISLDTPIYVYTLLKHFSDRVVQGDPINTRFRKNEYSDKHWWKHK